jgi:hypothetical protein
MMEVSLEEAMDMLDDPEDQNWRKYQVWHKEASNPPFHIQHYTIGQRDKHRLARVVNEGMDRDTGWGEFTRLVEEAPDGREDENDNWFTGPDGKRYRIWMSDTRAEIMEHGPILNKLWLAEEFQGVSVLINGLGLGVIARAAVINPGVERVDVVEINPKIAELVGPLIPSPKLHIHVANAFNIRWPKGTTWDLAWHDIWPTISDENLPQMAALHRKYGHRVGWQGSWQREGCEEMASDVQRMKDGTMPMAEAIEKYIRLSGKLGNAVVSRMDEIPPGLRKAK